MRSTISNIPSKPLDTTSPKNSAHKSHDIHSHKFQQGDEFTSSTCFNFHAVHEFHEPRDLQQSSELRAFQELHDLERFDEFDMLRNGFMLVFEFDGTGLISDGS